MELLKTTAQIIVICMNTVLLVLGITGVITTLFLIYWTPEGDNTAMQMIAEMIKLNKIRTYGSIIICSCLVVFVIVGSFGVLTGNDLLLKWYYIGLGIAFACSIISLMFAFIYTSNLSLNVKEDMTNVLKNYHTDPNTRQMIDKLQYKLNCCGVDSYNDWILLINYIPGSCCNQTTEMIEKCQTDQVMDKYGCLQYFDEVLYVFNAFILAQSIVLSTILLIVIGTVLYVRSI